MHRQGADHQIAAFDFEAAELGDTADIDQGSRRG
jgi:hypothetical protein